MKKVSFCELVFLVCFFLFIFIMIFTKSMVQSYVLDEDQFVASGVLLAKHGLFPYKDYAYFHTPYLVFIYGAMFSFTSYYLFTARFFNVVASFALCIALFNVAMSVLKGKKSWVRYGIAATIVMLLIFSPLFTFTSGLAWNHDFAIFLAVASFLLLVSGVKNSNKRHLFYAGLLLSVSIGVRLSLAPLIIPYIIILCIKLRRHSIKRSLMYYFTLMAGIFTGLIPLLIIFIAAPSQFLFGNFEYPALNTQFKTMEHHPVAMNFIQKITYLGQTFLEPGNLVILVLFILTAYFALKNYSAKPHGFEVLSVLLLLPFLLIGSFAPTPSWYMYFYVLVPFLLLGVIYCLASLSDNQISAIFPIIIIGVFFSGFFGIGQYQFLRTLGNSSQWVPIEIHNEGQHIASIVGNGRIVTLSPIFPLEGGLEIYPQFATGVFGYRVAHLVPYGTRSRMKLLSKDDIPVFLSHEKPPALVTGTAPSLENEMTQYSILNEYKLYSSYQKIIWKK